MLKKIVLTALLALGVAATTAVADTPIPPCQGVDCLVNLGK